MIKGCNQNGKYSVINEQCNNCPELIKKECKNKNDKRMQSKG